jgi:hypothetical protein
MAKQLKWEEVVTKMRMFTGLFEGYKATALQERNNDGWRIRTWHENDHEHDYWVQDGRFYVIDIQMRSNTLIGQNVDDTVPRAKREALLHLIAKWKAEGPVWPCPGLPEHSRPLGVACGSHAVAQLDRP